ncbi:tetratricopeptide repeat protein [Flavobacterium sp.]|uniref:tetratricopeptide repeat-containing sensor histidine kinase n=1 Tax=Flavobacterium sp. TaxID=239 RepID=UPI00391D303C
MKIKLLLFFSVFSLFLNGQNKTIDSLILELKKANSDIVRSKILNNLANEYSTNNPKLMLDYANKALKLSSKIGFKIEQGNAYHYIGNANIIFGNYAKALDNFAKAQNIFENEIRNSSNEIEIKNGLARAYGSIGFVFMQQSNYAKALSFNFKALKIFQETNNLVKLAAIYNNIGVIYKSQGDYFKSLNYYEKCLTIQEKLKDENIGTTTNNIGLVYLNLKDFPKGLEYFNKSKLYFNKYPNAYGLAQLYYNYGLYYKGINQNEKAVDYTNKALTVFNNIENKFMIADCYALLGTIYFGQSKHNLALEFTTKALVIAKELNILDKIQSFEKLLSEIYEKQNNLAESLKHYKLYSIAKDSLANAETVKSTIRAEMSFDFDRKEMLQKEELFKKDLVFKQQSKLNQIKIAFAMFLVLFVCGIMFLIYNKSVLKKKLTLEKELAVYEQKALHLQMNPHFIFNCLGSITSFIVKNSTEAAINYLAKFSKLMRLTLEYSKETLIPIDKEIESLQNYLELEQLRFNHSFQFQINKDSNIDDDVALPPLLLQPFIENAIIHGVNPKVKTGLIVLDFTIENDSLVCVVTDNGIGINVSKELKDKKISMHKSMALDITKKRLEMMETSTTKETKVSIEQIEENGQVKGTKAMLILPLQYLPNL